MAITVYPYKLTQRELKARLAPGVTVLPGQLLRFGGESPVYGKVQEVRALPPSVAGMPEGVGVVVDLLYGAASMEPQTVALLTDEQIAHDVQALLGPLAQPIRLSEHFSADLDALGAFTLVEGDDFLLKIDALQCLIEAIRGHRRVLIIDPLGLFEAGQDYAYWKAGRELRLSVQDVGARRFLDAFGELFPPALREVVLRAVADHMYTHTGFIGFNRWLNLETAVNVPLKNLIVQQYHAVIQEQVFADTPEQVASLQTSGQAVCVLDVSELSDPWKSLFYSEMCRVLFSPDVGGIIPVLLYPEKHLPDLQAWLQRAEGSGVNAVVVASAWLQDEVRKQASNRLWVDSDERMLVQGALTCGLPVNLPLTGREHDSLPVERAVPVVLPSPTPSLLPPDVPEMIPQTPAEIPPDTLPPVEMLEAVMPPEMPVAPTDAVVNLSAPIPVHELSFLTAEQLSELLTSKPKSSELRREIGSANANPISEATKPPPMPRSAPVAAPVVFEDLGLDTVSVVASQEADLYSSFQVDLDEALVTPAEPLPSVPSASLAEADEEAESEEPLPEAFESIAEPEPPPSHPPFPLPEEYEREEFSFDLEPEAVAAHAEAPDSSAVPPGIAPSVSRSLSEFNQDLPLADEPLFALDPDSLRPPELAPAMEAAIPPVPMEMPDVPETSSIPPLMEPNEAMLSEVLEQADLENGILKPETLETETLEDVEMREALDLIFPMQPEGQAAQAEASLSPREPTAADSNSAPPPVASPVPADEPVVPIHLKPELPVVAAQNAFQVGERVRHGTYGEGIIQKMIPMEDTVVLNILFDTVGKRLLDPVLCELTPA